MIDKYILKGTKVVKCHDVLEWAKFMENHQTKIVQQTMLLNGKWVSTVFLGLNHRFGKGNPLLFETMVFPSRNDLKELACVRYSTYKQALKGHWKLTAEWSEK